MDAYDALPFVVNTADRAAFEAEVRSILTTASADIEEYAVYFQHEFQIKSAVEAIRRIHL